MASKKPFTMIPKGPQAFCTWDHFSCGSKPFQPRANPWRQIRVTRRRLLILSLWLRPQLLTLGPTL